MKSCMIFLKKMKILQSKEINFFIFNKNFNRKKLNFYEI